MEGVFCVYKPKGISSRAYLNQVKAAIIKSLIDSQKIKASELDKKWSSIKIGHGGTLDPMARGLLVGINEGCKKLSLMLQGKKRYLAIGKFGLETDTLDTTGKIISTGSFDHIQKDHIQNILKKFTGTFLQTPPLYSALHFHGRRLYEIARKNVSGHIIPDIPQRPVTVDKIDLLSFESPIYQLDVTCSGGTYIRSLIRDIGRSLNSFSTLTELERVQVGSFVLDDCIRDLSQIISKNPSLLHSIIK